LSRAKLENCLAKWRLALKSLSSERENPMKVFALLYASPARLGLTDKENKISQSAKVKQAARSRQCVPDESRRKNNLSVFAKRTSAPEKPA
jgi:hypothetical protein